MGKPAISRHRQGGTQGKIAVLAPPVELPINRKWTSRYAKRKVIPDSESLRRGEHNAPISNTHRRRPYGNLGDRPLGGRYVRYGISTGVGVCTWWLAETNRAGASEHTHKILLRARLYFYPGGVIWRICTISARWMFCLLTRDKEAWRTGRWPGSRLGNV